MHDNQWRDTYKKLIMIRELEDRGAEWEKIHTWGLEASPKGNQQKHGEDNLEWN
jgi:hypothetical protein